MNNDLKPFQSHWVQLLSRSFAVSVISTVSLLSGLTPSLNGQFITLKSGVAVAQNSLNLSDQEITNYARAVIALESRRHQVFNEIKKIVGEVPRIVCDEPSSINALPGNAPQLAVSYCDQAKRIIRMKGLTVDRFNQITHYQQTDSRLREQIQAKILQLLQSPQQQ